MVSRNWFLLFLVSPRYPPSMQYCVCPQATLSSPWSPSTCLSSLPCLLPGHLLPVCPPCPQATLSPPWSPSTCLSSLHSGNPVSSLVTFYLFVLPALRQPCLLPGHLLPVCPPCPQATLSPPWSPSTCLSSLPSGNPVSSLVTFYLFVLPALRKIAGWTNYMLTQIPVEVRICGVCSLIPR